MEEVDEEGCRFFAWRQSDNQPIEAAVVRREADDQPHVDVSLHVRATEVHLHVFHSDLNLRDDNHDVCRY